MDSSLCQNLMQLRIAEQQFVATHGRAPTDVEFTNFFEKHVADESGKYGVDFRTLLTLYPAYRLAYENALDLFGQESAPEICLVHQIRFPLTMLRMCLELYPQARDLLQ